MSSVATGTPADSHPIEPLNESKSIVILRPIFSGVGYSGKKFPSPGDSQTLTPVLGFPSGGRQQVREKVNEIFASAR